MCVLDFYFFVVVAVGYLDIISWIGNSLSGPQRGGLSRGENGGEDMVVE